MIDRRAKIEITPPGMTKKINQSTPLSAAKSRGEKQDSSSPIIAIRLTGRYCVSDWAAKGVIIGEAINGFLMEPDELRRKKA
jgi:hypothetical protein